MRALGELSTRSSSSLSISGAQCPVALGYPLLAQQHGSDDETDGSPGCEHSGNLRQRLTATTTILLTILPRPA